MFAFLVWCVCVCVSFCGVVAPLCACMCALIVFRNVACVFVCASCFVLCIVFVSQRVCVCVCLGVYVVRFACFLSLAFLCGCLFMLSSVLSFIDCSSFRLYCW